MRTLIAIAVFGMLVSACHLLTGCWSANGNANTTRRSGDFQRNFTHNDREYRKWVKNSSDKPKYRNLSTGARMH